MNKNHAERERKARVQPRVWADPRDIASGPGTSLATRRRALREDYFARKAAWNARVRAAKAQRKLEFDA